MGSKILNHTERQATLALLGLSGDLEDEETQADNSEEELQSRSRAAMHNNLKRSYDLLRENEENEERKYYPQQRSGGYLLEFHQQQPSSLNELPPPPPEKYVEPVGHRHPKLPLLATSPPVSGSVMIRIGKKRRDHKVVGGQFDDAYEEPPVFRPPAPYEPGSLGVHPSLLTGGGPTMQAPLLSLMAHYDEMGGAAAIPPGLQQHLGQGRYHPLAYTPAHPEHPLPPSTTTLDAQQQQHLYEQQQRRHHIETMLRAHLALQQLPPPPGRYQQAPFNHLRQGVGQLKSEVQGSTEGNAGGLPNLAPRPKQQQEQDKTQPSQVTRNQYAVPESYRAAADNYRAAANKYRASPPESKAATPEHVVAAFRKEMQDQALRSQLENQRMVPPVRSATFRDTPSNKCRQEEKDADGDDETVSTATASEAGGQSTTSPKGGAKATSAMSTKLRYEQYTPPSTWAELSGVPKMASVPPDDDMKSPVHGGDINPSDVLLGRGGMTNTNPGNKQF